MLYGRDLVDQNVTTEIALTAAVNDGSVTAMDANTLQPIDWQQLEADFSSSKKGGGFN